MQLYIDDELRITKVNSADPLETQEMGIEVGQLLRHSNPFIYDSVKPFIKPDANQPVSKDIELRHLASLSPDDTQGLAKIDIWSKDRSANNLNYVLDIEPVNLRKACKACDLNTDEIHRLRAISEWTALGIVQLDQNWSATFSNSAFHIFCGYEQNTFNGQAWLSVIHPEDRKMLIRKLRHSMLEKCRSEMEIRLSPASGTAVWMNVQCSPIYDFLNNFVGFVLIFLNINDRHQAEQKLLELALIDSLTGLYNRHAFIEKMVETFSMHRNKPNFAIMYIDLDGFKAINDELGHATGDILLNKVAQRLSKTVRQNDVVARLGGDEFAILLRNISDPLNAEQVAIQILDVISSPYYLGEDNKESFVSASIGIAVTESISEKVNYADKKQLLEITDQLLRCADTAMYKAKDAGRNTFRFYGHLVDTESTQMMSLSVALHHALENNEFKLHYQPQFDYRNRRIHGYEALLRWEHPQFGVLGPETYLPIIERSGMVHNIGKWIITQAFQDHARYIDATGDENVRLSINLSATQFRERNLVTTFEQLLNKYKIAPESVVIEITETVLMDSYSEIQQDLERLVTIGISIALDDFGTGYSSLSYLQKFPIQIIKIDQSFVQNIEQHESRMITQAIVNLAQSLGKKVIAEGVETEQQFNTLLGDGCYLFQGWYFNEAMTMTEIINNKNQSELFTRSQLI